MPTSPFKSDGSVPDISPTDPRGGMQDGHPDFVLISRINNGACLDVNSNELYYTIPRDGHPFGEANG